MKWIAWSLGIFLSLIVLWWILAAPPAELRFAGPTMLGPVPEELNRVLARDDEVGAGVRRVADALPGYDDVVLLADGTILASAMDGWIWRVDGSTGQAERFADVPLMPAGLRLAPDDPDVVYFCSAILSGESYPEAERVGLYALRVSTRQTQAIVLDVPREIARSREARVFSRNAPARVEGTRALAFCNDLDVSSDGQRIYFSEPFAYEGASMGAGAVAEAIALGSNGRLWMHDRSAGTTRLVARNFHFLDGVLIEEAPDSSRELSVLVTETTRFRIQRLFVDGPRAGTHVVLWDDLPGMPDGLDRDDEGIVWVGLLTLRSDVTDWLHANPWLKGLLVRLPVAWMPRGTSTAVFAFDAKAERALYLGLHDGSRVRDVSVVIPAGDRLILASFDPHQRGLVSIPRPVIGRRSGGDNEWDGDTIRRVETNE